MIYTISPAVIDCLTELFTPKGMPLEIFNDNRQNI